MTRENFELIARYIVAANDVIDNCGADAIEALRVLLQAAHAEAVKGLDTASSALQAIPVQLASGHADAGAIGLS